MNRKLASGFFALAALATGLATSSAEAVTLKLPPPNYITATTYNGFDVYSTDLLKTCSDAGDPLCKFSITPSVNSGPYPVQSSPGQIAGDIVVIAGTNGGQVKNMDQPFPNLSRVDNPLESPTGNGAGAQASYLMGNEPTGGANDAPFVGDRDGTWEINAKLLYDYLNGHDLVFLFDNNQSGRLLSQSLLVWGQVEILDASGTRQACVELSTGPANAGCNAVGSPPAGTPTFESDPVKGMNGTGVNGEYVQAIGNYCVNKTTGATYNEGIANNAGDCGAEGYFVNDNLSTSSAEYAIFSKYLNDKLAEVAGDQSKSDWVLSVSLRYFNNNAGAEQLFICSQCDVGENTRVPEPASLALLAAAMLGASGLGWKRRREARAG